MKLDRQAANILKAVITEQRLFRWAGVGAAHAWFRLAVVVRLLVRPFDGHIVFVLAGALLFAAEVRDMFVFPRRSALPRGALLWSGILFVLESIFLVAMAVRFVRNDRPAWETAISVAAIALLASDLRGAVHHFLWDAFDTKRAEINLASRRTTRRAMDDAAVGRQMRRMRVLRLVRRMLSAAGAVALLLLPVYLFGWSRRTIALETAVVSLLSLRGMPRRARVHRASRIPLPIAPLPEPVDIITVSLAQSPSTPRRISDGAAFATTRVGSEEVSDGVWELRIDFALAGDAGTSAAVTGVRVVCYEQVVVRDGEAVYGVDPPALHRAELRRVTDRLFDRERLALHIRKAFEGDMPMRVIFGVVLEYTSGSTRGEWMSDGIYSFIYRNATWPEPGPRTAQLVRVNEQYVEQMLRKTAAVDAFEPEGGRSESLSQEDTERFVQACAENPALPDLVIERRNVRGLRDLLRVHRR